MRKLLTTLLLLVSCASMRAQYIQPVVGRNGAYLLLDGETIDMEDAMDLLPTDLYRRYCTGRGLYYTGEAMTLGGLGAAAAGGLVIAGVEYYIEHYYDNTTCVIPFWQVFLEVSGAIGVLSGLASAAVGIPLWVSGGIVLEDAKKKMREPCLSLSPAPGGLGLALRF